MTRRRGSLRGHLTTVLIVTSVVSTLVLATVVFLLIQDSRQQGAET